MCEFCDCDNPYPCTAAVSDDGLTKRKFKAGNIVRYDGQDHTSAKAGAIALVVGYTSELGRTYLRVFWLSSLAGAQCNGGYSEENFTLLHENMENYRPDMIPQDRGITSGDNDYIAGSAVTTLQQAVEMVRALPDHSVTCQVVIDRTVTKVETEKKNL